MKTNSNMQKLFLLLIAIFTIITTPAKAAQWMALTNTDSDGFPVQFSISLDAMKTYFVEQTSAGYINVSGDTILQSTNGGRTYVQVQGGSGEEVLQKLNTWLDFRVVGPQGSWVNLSAGMEDTTGQQLFVGYASTQLEKRDRFWQLKNSNVEQSLVSWRTLYLSLPRAIDQVIVIPVGDDGTKGNPVYLQQDWLGRFGFNFRTLPQKAIVILRSFTSDQVIERAYDVQTGKPDPGVEVSQFVKTSINGMSIYDIQDAGTNIFWLYAEGKEQDSVSPTLSLTVKFPKVVKIGAYVLNQQHEISGFAGQASFRKAGEWTWSEPRTVGEDGMVTYLVAPGKYYYRFGWKNHFVPVNPSDGGGGPTPIQGIPVSSGGSGGGGFSSTTGEPNP